MSHLFAELHQFSNRTYEAWAHDVAATIRPALAKYEPAFADAEYYGTEDLIAPDISTFKHYGLYVTDRLVAFAALDYDLSGVRVQLDTLAVPPPFQGEGWGSALLCITEQISREAGYATMTLSAPSDVRSFYEDKHGYELDDSVDEPVSWQGNARLRKSLRGSPK